MVAAFALKAAKLAMSEYRRLSAEERAAAAAEFRRVRDLLPRVTLIAAKEGVRLGKGSVKRFLDRRTSAPSAPPTSVYASEPIAPAVTELIEAITALTRAITAARRRAAHDSGTGNKARATASSATTPPTASGLAASPSQKAAIRLWAKRLLESAGVEAVDEAVEFQAMAAEATIYAELLSPRLARAGVAIDDAPSRVGFDVLYARAQGVTAPQDAPLDEATEELLAREWEFWRAAHLNAHEGSVSGAAPEPI